MRCARLWLICVLLAIPPRAAADAPVDPGVIRLSAAERHLEAEPRSWWAHAEWVVAMREADRERDRARLDAARASANPRDPYLVALAAWDVHGDHPGEATAMLEAAARAAPSDPWGPYGLARLPMERETGGPGTDAQQLWKERYPAYQKRVRARAEEALRLDPNFALAYSLLADTCTQPGHRMDAVTSSRKAVELEPSRSWFHLELASKIEWLLDEEEEEGGHQSVPAPEASHLRAEALGAVQRAVDLDRDWGGWSRGSAVSWLSTLLDRGAPEGEPGRRLLSRELARTPHESQIRLALASRLADSGDLDAALALLREDPPPKRLNRQVSRWGAAKIEQLAVLRSGHRTVAQRGNDFVFDVRVPGAEAEAIDVAVEDEDGRIWRPAMAAAGPSRATAVRRIPPGRYTYSIWVGGKPWELDPCAPEYFSGRASFRVSPTHTLGTPDLEDEANRELVRLGTMAQSGGAAERTSRLVDLLRRHPRHSGLLGLWADRSRGRVALTTAASLEGLPAEVSGDPSAMAYLRSRFSMAELAPFPTDLEGSQCHLDRFWQARATGDRARHLLDAQHALSAAGDLFEILDLAQEEPEVCAAILAAAPTGDDPRLDPLLATAAATSGQLGIARIHWKRAVVSARERWTKRQAIEAWVSMESSELASAASADPWLEAASLAIEEFPYAKGLIGTLESLPASGDTRTKLQSKVTTALAAHPDAGPLWHLQSHVREAEGDEVGGEAAIRRAIGSDQFDGRSRAHLGRALTRKFRFSDALPFLQAAVALGERDADTLAALGYCQLAAANAKAAIEALEEVLSVSRNEEQRLWAEYMLASSLLLPGGDPSKAFPHAYRCYQAAWRDAGGSLMGRLLATAVLVGAGMATGDRGKVRQASDALAKYPFLPWALATLPMLPLVGIAIPFLVIALLFRSWRVLRSVAAVLALLMVMMFLQGCGAIWAGKALFGRWLLPFLELGQGQGMICWLIGYGAGAAPLAGFALLGLGGQGEGLGTLDFRRLPRIGEVLLGVLAAVGILVTNFLFVLTLLSLFSSSSVLAFAGASQFEVALQAGLCAPQGVWVAGLMFVFVAPIAEELFFRGYVYRRWASLMGPKRGAALAAMLFSVIHLRHFFQLFLAGLVFTWLLERRGSLWPAVLAHMAMNLFVLVAMVAGFGT